MRQNPAVRRSHLVLVRLRYRRLMYSLVQHSSTEDATESDGWVQPPCPCAPPPLSPSDVQFGTAQ
eukprot:2096485-Pyramimonas_sp.AAC.2